MASSQPQIPPRLRSLLTIVAASLFIAGIVLVLSSTRTRFMFQSNLSALEQVREGIAHNSSFALPACQGGSSSSAPVGVPSLAEQDSRWLANQGFERWIMGECDAAVQHWEKALALDPADPITRYQLGVAYCHMGQYAQGQVVLKGIGDLDALREGITSLGNQAENLTSRLEWLEVAFCASPTRAAYRRIEKALIELGQAAESPGYLNLLVQFSSPETFDHWWAQGAAAENSSDWTNARKNFIAAVGYTVNEDELALLWQSAARVSRLGGDDLCAQIFSQQAVQPNEVDKTALRQCALR